MAYLYSPAPVKSVNNQKGEVRVFEYAGEWAAGDYPKDSLVTSGGWTLVANKDTNEAAAPKLRAAVQYAYQGNNLITGEFTTKKLLVGQRIVADYAQAVHGVRVYGRPGMKYSLYGVPNISSTPPFSNKLWEVVADSEGWIKAEISPPVYVKKGTTYDIYVIIEDTTSSPVTTNAQYVYKTPSTSRTPVNGEIVHPQDSPGFLLVNKTDNQGGNQTGFLASLGVNDSIVIDGFTYYITGNTEYPSYYEIGVTPTLLQVESVYTVTFNQVAESNILFSSESGYWDGTNESGLYNENGEYEFVNVTNWQYSLDVEIGAYDTSDDWDVISYVTASAFSPRDYQLPIASASVLGGIKVGTTLAIDGDGILDAVYPVTSVNGETGDVNLDKSDVGLGNVDNTSDLDKPVSTATQAALDLKADIGYVDSQDAALQGNIDLKADITYVDTADSGLQSQINARALTTYVDQQDNNLDTIKADITYVDSQDAALQGQIDALPTTQYVDDADAALQGQIDLLPTTTYVDNADAALQADIDTRTIYTTQTPKYQGEYDGRQYEPLDIATQDGWLGWCLNQTTDPIKPQVVGSASYLYQGSGMTDANETSARICTVQRYTATDNFYLVAFRTHLKADTSIDIFINNNVVIPNAKLTYVASFEADVDGIYEISLASAVLIAADTTFDVIGYISDLTPNTTTVPVNYNYSTPNNPDSPASGVASHSDKELSVIRFNAIDNDATDRTSLFQSLSPGSTLTFNSYLYQIQDVTDAGGYWAVAVSPAIQQQPDGLFSMSFEYANPDSINYSREVNYWGTNSNISSAFDAGGDYQTAIGGTFANYQYPVDIKVQGVTFSDNWAILASSDSGATGGGGGGDQYILPVATDTTLGGIKSSASIAVDGGTGVATVDRVETDTWYATAAQGALADTALQPSDNVSELTNDAGYLDATHSSTTSGVHGISAFGATLVDDADAAAARTTLSCLSSNINDYPTMS